MGAFRHSIVGIAFLGLLSGCGGGDPFAQIPELQPDKSYQADPPGTDNTRHVAADHTPRPEYNQINANVADGRIRTPLDPPPPRQPEPVQKVSETVKEAIPFETAKSAGPVPLRPVGTSSGQYFTLGAVVAEVNGTPIYANKIVRAIEPELRARAKDLEPDKFKTFAMEEIRKKTQGFIRDELEFAAAQRNLGDQERVLAEAMTSVWRQRQITEAGGSIEQARKKAAAEGLDFEEMVQERFRFEMRRIYFQKKEMPKIQVTATDMRRYYQQNLDREFSEQSQAHFRLIPIEISRIGDEALARQKARDLMERARKGEDFATLAAQGTDPALAKKGGDLGWVDRGAFRLEAIERAVWELEAGQVTDVLEVGGTLYVAKLEGKKVGRQMAFEEQAVQDKIRRTLETQQFNQLREQVQAKLIANAIVYPNPPNYTPALDLAMQSYGAWASAGD
jgi:hypothetical protein